MMEALWWMFGLLMVALILRIRFHRSTDEYCEFCDYPIDTQRDNFYSMQFAIELGIVRSYDDWFFCSYECQQMHIDNVIGDSEDV